MDLAFHRHGRALRLCHRVGLPLVALLLAGSANAVTITLSKFPPNPGVLPGGGWKYSPGSNFGNPPGPRAWVNGVYGGLNKTVVTDLATVAGRAGPLSLTASSSIGLADGAGAVARCLLGGGVVCAAGTAAAAAYAAYRVYAGPDGLTADPGIEPVTGTSPGYVTGATPGTLSLTRAESCNKAAIANEGAYGTVQDQGDGTFFCLMYRSNNSYINGQSIDYYGPIDTSGCPLSIDPTNPAYNVPAGSPVGIDGKCPTARYNHIGVTPAQAASRVTANPPVFPNTTWRDAVRDAVDSGGQSVPAEITSSGPESQTGTPTQTVTTQGTTTTTTTSTPTYNYTYAGDTITYNTTNVTNTTINNNGTVTSSTTTTTGPTPTTQDPEDPCTANPDRLGCVKVGTPAEQPDLYAKKDKTFDDALDAFKTTVQASPLGTAISGFFDVAAGGTCPTFSAHIPFINADLVIDQFCSDFATDALTLLRAAVLLIAGIAAFRVAML